MNNSSNNIPAKHQFLTIDFEKPTDLCEIMYRNKSDKAGTHNYTIVYDFIFKHLREKSINILECGLGSNNPDIPSNMGLDGRPGASLFGWSEYFPKANIYGCDIDKDIKISDGRIKTFFCDQTKPETIKEMLDRIPEQLDIIIDDGWHVFHANKSFFENSFHKLKEGGIYVIEDVYSGHGNMYKKYLKDYGITNSVVMQLPLREALDNCLAIIFKN
jgi:hypothetical protein